MKTESLLKLLILLVLTLTVAAPQVQAAQMFFISAVM